MRLEMASEKVKLSILNMLPELSQQSSSENFAHSLKAINNQSL